MSSIENYRFMLLEISNQIRTEELEGMKFLCVEFIPDSKREDTKGTLHFFRELEMQNRLGIDNLDWLISMLQHLKRQDLVLKLTGFQLQRKMYLTRLCPCQRESLTPTQETINSQEYLDSTVVHSDSTSTTDYHYHCSESHGPSTCHHSVKSSSYFANDFRQPGEFALRCILRLATTGAWLGGSAYLLNRYKDDPEALVTMVTGVVLPTGVMVRYITAGSIKMVLWATDLHALNALWKRYKAGQLRDDLEKVMVTDELKEQANGEQIEFIVEIDEEEYRNACLDLVIAQKQAEQSYQSNLLSSRRRSRSVDNLTSLKVQEMSRDMNWPVYPESMQKEVSMLSTKSVSFSSRKTSLGSETSDDDSSQLLDDFLEFSEKAHHVCALLDRPMVICSDWRNLASEFSYKMIHIRLWEKNQSPCMTLLKNVVTKDPETRVSKLIDKLLAIDRLDVVRLIQGREPKSDPRALWHLPFSTRKQLSFELDNATKEQFHLVVSEIIKAFEGNKILESLRNRPSPTMALLEELETMCPCLPVSQLRDACSRAKMAGKKFTDEELNYFRLCSVITRSVLEGLRTVFKQQWGARYQVTHGQWLDVPANAIDFFNMESPRNQRRNARLLTTMTNGNTNQWDCTCLFYAILFSDCLGSFLNPTVRKSVDELREIRNDVFAHTADGRLADVDFDDAMRKILAAFKGLGLNTTQVDEVKNQKSFPTNELNRIQQQLSEEKERYAKFNSFCVLPPKPSHDTTDRVDEVMTIIHEMEKLRSTKKNETTVIYLSGNPGCGKSEIARQIGNRYFNKIPVEAAQLKFVFTFDASSIETLLQSYVDFAARLSCDEDFVSRIATSKDLNQEEKIKQIKGLINPKVQVYLSWLIIIDNVNDLKLVSKYLPQAGEKTSGDGQILVTTQDSQTIPLDTYIYHYSSLKEGMKEDDAITLLAQISGIMDDRHTLLNIASALDFQPLALACAAVNMQQVFHYADQSEAKWEKYLLKLQEGKREATEEAFKKTTKSYKSAMTVAVKLALERVSSEDEIMMYAFQFLSVIANEPIPLKYVIKYVMKCMPDEDQDLVAAHVSLSSLIISSEDVEMSKAVRVHQVVYHGLQKLFKNNGFDIMKLVSVFSDLPSFKNFYDVTKEEIITTRLFSTHFVAVSGKLQELGLSDLTDESLAAVCLFKAGSICSIHGRYEASEIFLELCLSIQERANNSVSVAMGENQIYNSSTTVINKSHEEKQSHFDGKLTCSGNISSALATTLRSLGALYTKRLDYRKAQIHLETALAMEERLYKGDHPELAITLEKLGHCLFQLGQHGKAEAYLQRALEIQEKESGKNNHLLADILIDLIQVLQSQGEMEKAMRHYEKVLELEQKFHDIASPQLSITAHNLGLCSSNFQKEQKATKFYEKALEIDEGVYHVNHPFRAIALINLGCSLLRMGEKDRAKCYFEEALATCENGNDQNDPLLADALHNLGSCLNELRQYEKAQEYLERALFICEKKGDECDPELAHTLCSLGVCFFQQRLYEKANAYWERALCIFENGEIKNDQQLANTITLSNNIGACHIRQKQYEKAKTYLERALSLHKKRDNENDPRLAKTLHYFGQCLHQQKDYVKATTYMERALSIYEKGEDENDPELSRVLNDLGSCLSNRKEYDRAKACLERALSIDEKINDPEIATTLHNLGACLASLKKYDEAKLCYERAMSIKRKWENDTVDLA